MDHYHENIALGFFFIYPMGFGYKGLVFCTNNGKHGQGTHSTKMGADKSFKKNPKFPKIYLPDLSAQAHNSVSFNEKRLDWVPVVRAPPYAFLAFYG